MHSALSLPQRNNGPFGFDCEIRQKENISETLISFKERKYLNVSFSDM